MKNSERMWLHLLIAWFWFEHVKPLPVSGWAWIVVFFILAQMIIALYYLILTILDQFKEQPPC